MEQNKYITLASKIIILCGMSMIILILWRHLSRSLTPFLLAAAISYPIKKISGRICKKLGISRKICAALLLILILLTISAVLGGLISALASEIVSLADRISKDPGLITDSIENTSEKLRSMGGMFSVFGSIREIPELSIITKGLENFFSDAVSGMVSVMGDKLSGAAISAVSGIPSFLLFLIVFLMSSFYFVCDDGKISGFFVSLLPEDFKKRLPAIVSGIENILIKYITASLTLCIITFFIVLAGLLTIKCRYAVLLSLLIAAVDLLPLLGTGAVLIPWAVMCFINSYTPTGIALMVVWVIATVVRQIAEPKIIGKNIGLHPLAALASVYIGAKLAGFCGLFLGPLFAVGIKAILPIFQGKNAQ